jgi:hypothetical protein
MRDTTLPHQADWDSPWGAHGTTTAEHRSARALWVLIALSVALTAADTLTTWLRLSTAASQHLAVSRLEWNPLMAAVIQTYGFAGALAWQVGGALLLVGVLPLIWRIQWSEAIRDTPSQSTIRRLVLGAALLASLTRFVVTGSNVSLLLGGGVFPPPSPSDIGAIPGAAATATASALATTTTTSATPSVSPTASPTRTPGAAPTATPTATPVPTSLTVTPTSVHPCVGGPDATFTVTYTGGVSPATITVDTHSGRFQVSLDNGTTIGQTESGPIDSGAPVTVLVRAQRYGQTTITVNVPGAPQQSVMADTSGGGCGSGG